MSLTFAQMKTALYRYGFDSTDPVGTWINSALHDFEVAADWDFLEVGETTISVTPGTSVLTLPSDFARPIVLRDNTNLIRMKYWERHKFARMVQDPTDVGLPELYTMIGDNQMQIWRVPYTPINFGLIYQASTPDLVNDTDTPTTGTTVWPSPVHYAIVVHAAEIALMAENEEDRAQTAQKQYMDMLIRLMGRYAGNCQLTDVESVEDTQGYGTDMPIQGSIGGW